MQQIWLNFWQSVSAGSLLASVGALLRMYSLGIEQTQQIERLRDEVRQETTRNDAQDVRLIAAEVVLARIDANVQELLEAKRSERHRLMNAGEGGR